MKILKNNKKFIIIYSILLIISIGLVIFTFHNYSLYKRPIVKVIETKDEFIDTETVTFGYTEEIYLETIKAKIMNGEHKGKVVTIENEYHKGEAFDQRFRKGDELFISLNISEGKIKNVHIEEYKRDKYIVLLIVFFYLILILVGKLKGLLSIVSVIVNIVIFN